MMTQEKIRFVTLEDAVAIREIYKPYIEETCVTFEYETPPVEEFERRITKIAKEYPYIVYTVDGIVRGYAYASRHKERAAYMWDVDLAIYLDTAYTNKGIGSKLYQVLMELLKEQNICNVYGVVTSPNPASEKMHTQMGFERCGIYKKTGYKFGEWRDVVWFGKCIGDTSCEPKPLKRIDELNPQVLEKMLENALV